MDSGKPVTIDPHKLRKVTMRLLGKEVDGSFTRTFEVGELIVQLYDGDEIIVFATLSDVVRAANSDTTPRPRYEIIGDAFRRSTEPTTQI